MRVNGNDKPINKEMVTECSHIWESAIKECLECFIVPMRSRGAERIEEQGDCWIPSKRSTPVQQEEQQQRRFTRSDQLVASNAHAFNGSMHLAEIPYLVVHFTLWMFKIWLEMIGST